MCCAVFDTGLFNIGTRQRIVEVMGDRWCHKEWKKYSIMTRTKKKRETKKETQREKGRKKQRHRSVQCLCCSHNHV